MRRVLNVRVQPRAGRSTVEETGPDSYKVRVSAAPEKGKANKDVINRLAEYFNVPASRLKIVRGAASRDKLIEIDFGAASLSSESARARGEKNKPQ